LYNISCRLYSKNLDRFPLGSVRARNRNTTQQPHSTSPQPFEIDPSLYHKIELSNDNNFFFFFTGNDAQSIKSDKSQSPAPEEGKLKNTFI